MLSIGRALMTNPRLLILDEATEGLAPLVAREIWRILTIRARVRHRRDHRRQKLRRGLGDHRSKRDSRQRPGRFCRKRRRAEIQARVDAAVSGHLTEGPARKLPGENVPLQRQFFGKEISNLLANRSRKSFCHFHPALLQCRVMTPRRLQYFANVGAKSSRSQS